MNYDSIREYARQYAELAHSPAQEKKRQLWKDLNSFRFKRPVIYVRKIPYNEFFDFSVIKSEEPLLRQVETELAASVLFRQKLRDDFIFEPWVKIRAKFTEDRQDRWGVPCALREKTMAFGAAAFVPSIKNEEDIEKIKPLKCGIDEKATAKNLEMAAEALDGILDVAVDRQGIFSVVDLHGLPGIYRRRP
jgi:hypothetical protein